MVEVIKFRTSFCQHIGDLHVLRLPVRRGGRVTNDTD